MAKRRQSEDVIQRQGLLRHLAREYRALAAEFETATADRRAVLRGRVQQIELTRVWLQKQAVRASKPGGIGRR